MTFEEIKKIINNAPEYDFLRTESDLGKNIILLGLGGSYAYGTNKEGSDIDVRGITYNRKEDLLRSGLIKSPFEQYVKADKETDTDAVIYSFNKMIELLLSCNPNTIEILGSPLEEYLYLSDVGHDLLGLKESFLSKRCIKTFTGYANQQLYRLKQRSLCAMSAEEYNEHISKVLNRMTENYVQKFGITPEDINAYVVDGDLKLDISITSLNAEDICTMLNELNATIRDYTAVSKRNKKAVEHDKVSKHAMHLLRLYMMGIDILDKHEIITKRVDEHDLLMSIRNDEWLGEDGKPNADFFKLVEEYEQKFEKAAENTTLPEKPDYEKVMRFVDAVNYKHITEVE